SLRCSRADHRCRANTKRNRGAMLERPKASQLQSSLQSGANTDGPSRQQRRSGGVNRPLGEDLVAGGHAPALEETTLSAAEHVIEAHQSRISILARSGGECCIATCARDP